MAHLIQRGGAGPVDSQGFDRLPFQHVVHNIVWAFLLLIAAAVLADNIKEYGCFTSFPSLYRDLMKKLFNNSFAAVVCPLSAQSSSACFPCYLVVILYRRRKGGGVGGSPRPGPEAIQATFVHFCISNQ